MLKICRYGLHVIISYILLVSFCVLGARAADVSYRVKRVIDGDTIELDTGERVRYIGIDTPETMKKTGGTWIFDPEPYGVEAKEYNRTLTEGKEVKLEFDAEKTDKYGRLLAYVRTSDMIMVNRELLKKGFARILFIPPNTILS